MIRKKIPRWLAGGLFILFGVAICLPVLMLVSVLVPMLAFRCIGKRSIVERLREGE